MCGCQFDVGKTVGRLFQSQIQINEVEPVSQNNDA